MGEHIPKFESREEEQRFWDETDLEDLSPEQLEEIKIPRPARPLSATFAVRFDDKTLEAIRRVAKAHGLGPTQLVRSWVLERLNLERRAGTLAERSGEYPAEIEIAMRRRIVDTLIRTIPAAAEEALQEVLHQADQETNLLSDRG